MRTDTKRALVSVRVFVLAKFVAVSKTATLLLIARFDSLQRLAVHHSHQRLVA